MSDPTYLKRIRNAMKPAAQALKEVDGLVRGGSHYDPDGIASAAVMAKALIREGKRFRLGFVKGINSEVFSSLEHEGYVIILDMGSGQLEAIKEMGAVVVICDHHITPELRKKFPIEGNAGNEFSPIETENGIIYEFNCHHFDLDGS